MAVGTFSTNKKKVIKKMDFFLMASPLPHPPKEYKFFAASLREHVDPPPIVAVKKYEKNRKNVQVRIQ